MAHGTDRHRQLERFFDELTIAVDESAESRGRIDAELLQGMEEFFGGLTSEVAGQGRDLQGQETRLREEFREFFCKLDQGSEEAQNRHRTALGGLERDLTGMFSLLEPTIAAATVAIKVMEERAQEERDRRLGRRFSTFDLVRTQELDFSRIFRGLLDPRGDHGQGDLFLSLLLEELNTEPKWVDSLRNFRAPAGRNSRVETEYSTGPIDIPTMTKKLSGSIDIVVQLEDNRWIGIENKPSAPDQTWQVDRYLISLWETVLRHARAIPKEPLQPELEQRLLLLYWSGDGTGPKLESLVSWPEHRREHQERLREHCFTVPYRGERFGRPSVEGWLTRCWLECRAERVRTFLHELLEYVRRRFTDFAHSQTCWRVLE